VFHILDESEVEFPFSGMVELHDKETPEKMTVDADGVKADFLEAMAEFQRDLKKEIANCGADYVPLHTGMPFDRALTGYLVERSKRG
jgi:hypothetical protein